MLHRDLVRTLAAELSSEREARLFLGVLAATLRCGLVRDGAVRLRGLGTFRLVRIPANEVVSGITGARMLLPRKLAVALRLSLGARRSLRLHAGMQESVRMCFGRFDSSDVECRSLCRFREACHRGSPR